MRQSFKFLTAVASVALLIGASASAFAAELPQSERLLSNHPDGVDAYTLNQQEDVMRLEPAAGDAMDTPVTKETKVPITNVRGPERPLGNNPDGIAGYTAADQKLEWQYMQRHHPAAIEPAGGGHGNVPSQGTYNKFIDDPFGDIEE